MKLDLNKKPLVIGMIHLPVTLSYDGWSGLNAFVNKAIRDLHSLENGGVDAALIENDGDQPCQVKGTADVVASMTVVAHELAKIAKIPLGIEVLLNDPKASLSIAKTCGLSFIRTDYFVDKMTREGYGEFDVDPLGLLTFQHKIGAEDIKILADVQVKYATMIDKTKTIVESAQEAMRFGADGIIITGTKTGEKPVTIDIKAAKDAVDSRIPVLVGSGLSVKNTQELVKYADGFIVGSAIKTGDFVDVLKVKSLIAEINDCRYIDHIKKT
jgi:membrane complex biogenesis BtpA family protein